MTVKDRLQALGIVLPPVAVPAAAYVPFVCTGSLVFLSGHIAKQSGKPSYSLSTVFKLTSKIDLKLAWSRSFGLPPIEGGIGGIISSSGQFQINENTTIPAQIGAHARSAYGVAQLPMGACVEIELIAEVE